jgi:hypothetical protein
VQADFCVRLQFFQRRDTANVVEVGVREGDCL